MAEEMKKENVAPQNNEAQASATKEVTGPKKPNTSTRTQQGRPDSKKTIWEKKASTSHSQNRGNKDKNSNSKQRSSRNFSYDRSQNEFQEKVVQISRVTKVVKGGRRFSFAAYVVVGDKKGRIGFGHGKANEVPDAIKKAIKDAKNNIVTVPIENKITVPHEVQAKFLASRVLLKPAPKGKGIVASGTVRAVVELAGYSDIYTKTYGSRSKTNIVRATFKALEALRTPKQIAEIRGKEVKDLLG
ncbi:30S ribosomal protein S5 [Mycoplasma sp. Mirounga ES2805-ORL]|uniref:30S ribosomal protein S5 n=1 Tax=Mycoplasma sp. Mirounga ES2805-ORL TaxID=754514 RepID=UPI00197C262C|nr:30S ribosomal protein S5 [Mycoplasma sp. Mirounga ES2805-ORL]QSF13948.1 30S ribosomal protein S5 [Mycoplasma sp. Mirounga ES2805-ORL]